MEIHPIDPASQTPPFEQLRQQIARRVASGELSAGERLPTVRTLADALGLAANTVARAYKELDADAVVVTEGRRGTFIASQPQAVDLQPEAAAYVTAARKAGLTLAESQRLIEQGWSRP